MENDLYKAYAEVDEILTLMESEYIEKIPKKMREMFKNERKNDYNPLIQVDVPLDRQKLQRKTFAILAMLNLNYWCEDEEKQRLIEIYTENDKKREIKLKEIYNPDSLFKNKLESEQIETKEMSLTEYNEESFLKKVIKKVMSLFKRN